jgi:hypothetical protein
VRGCKIFAMKTRFLSLFLIVLAGLEVSTSLLSSRKHQVKWRLRGTSRPYLHEAEYPNDDFTHIFGHGDPNHVQSRLQDISALRIEEVVRNKKPIDAVRNDYL